MEEQPEAESQRREEAQRPQEEIGGRQRLGHEAAAWAIAKYLRVYLAAFESVNKERSGGSTAWSALSVEDGLDPLGEQITFGMDSIPTLLSLKRVIFG